MVDRLSQDRIDEFKEAFDIFDLDRSGNITSKELKAILENLGQNPTEEEIILMIREVIPNAVENTDIYFKDFLNLMTNKMQDVDTEEELIEAFKIFDKDGHGFISTEDLKNGMRSAGERLVDYELEEIIRIADTDDDGYINYKEFIKMVLNR